MPAILLLAIGQKSSLLSSKQVLKRPLRMSIDPIVDPLSEMSPSGETDDGIYHMGLDELSNVATVVPVFDIEVSSVSKQESTIGKSPAAVFVITNEMIQRSGETCGFEWTGNWETTENWTLRDSYSFLFYDTRYANPLEACGPDHDPALGSIPDDDRACGTW